MDCVELSIKSLEEKCNTWACGIKKTFNPDLVIYIARGGYLIGKAMSDVFHTPLLAINSQRHGNSLKELLVPILSRLPRRLCNLLREIELKSNIHNKKNNRSISFVLDTVYLDTNSIHKIIIVDDSIDTGISMSMAVDLVKKNFPKSEVKTAALNVMDASEAVIKIDYCCYKNVMLRTPMSKDSKEYQKFCKLYELQRK